MDMLCNGGDLRLQFKVSRFFFSDSHSDNLAKVRFTSIDRQVLCQATTSGECELTKLACRLRRFRRASKSCTADY